MVYLDEIEYDNKSSVSIDIVLRSEITIEFFSQEMTNNEKIIKK